MPPMLRSKNTHLPLKERIRVALTEDNKRQARAFALAQATPEQIKELNRTFNVWQHISGNKIQYAQHVADSQLSASAQTTSNQLNALASIGNQAQDALDAFREAERAVFGDDSVYEPDDEEVNAELRKYLGK